jgi:Arc/MetJ family transcription regulator
VRALVALQAEYAAWHDAIPDATRESATDEALQTIVEFDLDDRVAIPPPRGFGRD